ncbi:para-nitrobenzyl esterase [Psychromonas sp. psych-6C06]|uniref:carboxylesterase family protein n=1 Tax=Psychromonas sp. psych-6C06 TaxID=2058089 RepID=UPI000C3475A6|nr:carboxylesterase family protein [Psychromonas sp. psych-6C06]PKF61569.1 para-nitrobenzyl esterase [Psychromonas sp. psych-6C06]
MTFFTRSLLALVISSFVVGCGNEVEPTVPMPEKPPVIEPEPARQEIFQIGNVEVLGTVESVLINDQMGSQKLVSIDTFKGIQFATQSRFQHSKYVTMEETLNSDGQVDATNYGASCPQAQNKTTQTIDEDCLYLNIWRPSGAESGKTLPVYVFIHGGDFEYGSGSEPVIEGDTIVAQGADDKKDFIYVSFNYRLGLLGSYWVDGANNTEGGNFGLGDQKRVLEWVSNNISKFGGDASNVTLMGQGAGAMSVGILQSQFSQEVVAGETFQRAIMQSNPYGFEYKNDDAAKSYRKSICEEFDLTRPIFGCTNDADEKIKEKSIEEILTAQNELLNPVNKLVDWLAENVLGGKTATPMHNFMPFAPYIENDGDQAGYHFTEAPAQGGLTVDTVIGNNANEANSFAMLPSLTFLIPLVISELCDNTDNITRLSLCGGDPILDESGQAQLVKALSRWLDNTDNKRYLAQKVSQVSFDNVAKETERLTAYGVVTQLFFGLGNRESINELLSLTDYYPELENELGGSVANMKMYKMLMNDLLFNGPAREMAANSLEQGGDAIMYQFEVAPSFNIWGDPSEATDIFKAIGCISGACSGSELAFVFNKALRLDGSEVKPSSKELALMNKLSRLWFSEALFQSEHYNANNDNVIIIEDSGQINTEYDWDFNNHQGIDPLLRNGRLEGLKELELTLHHLF